MPARRRPRSGCESNRRAPVRCLSDSRASCRRRALRRGFSAPWSRPDPPPCRRSRPGERALRCRHGRKRRPTTGFRSRRAAFLSWSFMAITSSQLSLRPWQRAAGTLGGSRRLVRHQTSAARPVDAALTDGLTMTRPPSAPGTAPLISSRLRGTSTSTTRQVFDGAIAHAHVARHALTLEHAARRLALADRSRRAMRQRVAVGLHAARKVMPLHGARQSPCPPSCR